MRIRTLSGPGGAPRLVAALCLLLALLSLSKHRPCFETRLSALLNTSGFSPLPHDFSARPDLLLPKAPAPCANFRGSSFRRKPESRHTKGWTPAFAGVTETVFPNPSLRLGLRASAFPEEPRSGVSTGAGLFQQALLPAAAGAAEPTVPAAHGYVNDFAGVIDSGTRAHLDALIGDLRAKTGAEIAVVTVASTEPLTVFDYAMKIAETWKPGAAGKDNGVVFLVAVRDRKLHILTGYGIEGALPDGRVGEIRDRRITPRFRAGDYAGGIRDGTEALASAIAEEYGVALGAGVRAKRPASTPVPLIAIVLLLLFLILLTSSGLLPSVPTPGRPGRSPRGGFYGGSFGGGGFGGTGGGFGGFGGGSFGGGGAGGDW